jgi:hypothetical protein
LHLSTAAFSRCDSGWLLLFRPRDSMSHSTKYEKGN